MPSHVSFVHCCVRTRMGSSSRRGGVLQRTDVAPRPPSRFHHRATAIAQDGHARACAKPQRGSSLRCSVFRPRRGDIPPWSDDTRHHRRSLQRHRTHWCSIVVRGITAAPAAPASSSSPVSRHSAEAYRLPPVHLHRRRSSCTGASRRRHHCRPCAAPSNVSRVHSRRARHHGRPLCTRIVIIITIILRALHSSSPAATSGKM